MNWIGRILLVSPEFIKASRLQPRYLDVPPPGNDSSLTKTNKPNPSSLKITNYLNSRIVEFKSKPLLDLRSYPSTCVALDLVQPCESGDSLTYRDCLLASRIEHSDLLQNDCYLF
jgi:hypothetical protein